MYFSGENMTFIEYLYVPGGIHLNITICEINLVNTFIL